MWPRLSLAHEQWHASHECEDIHICETFCAAAMTELKTSVMFVPCSSALSAHKIAGNEYVGAGVVARFRRLGEGI